MQPNPGGPKRFYPSPRGSRASRAGIPTWGVQTSLTLPEDGKYTVIYPPTIDYGYMKQRPQHLMEQFATDGHRVYYLNAFPSPHPPQEVRPNLIVVHRTEDLNLFPRRRPVVLWMSWSESGGWIDRIHPDISVYDCLDDFPEWKAAELRLLPRVDLVFASSDILFHAMKERHPRVTLVRNACEYLHFSDLEDAADPPDWPPIPVGEPVIGYVGALGQWLDGDLIAKIAGRFHIVLVGPFLGHRGIQHPRVHYLGLRPYEVLPSYLKRMDVLTIPFLQNRITRATNPIKMYEYLATGKPIVATAIPEAVREPLVRVGRSPEEFLRHLVRAAAGHETDPRARAARQAVARANSWEFRYAQIRDAIDDIWRQKTQG